MSTADLDTFVGSSGDSVFDPQIQWDPQAGRWLYVAVVATGQTANDMCPANAPCLVAFGFSKTSDPSDLVNGWCRYSVSTGRNFDDYPKLGHNDADMLIGANVFGGTGAFLNATVRTAPKPAVGSTTCPSSVTTSSFTPTNAFTPVPANTQGSSANGYVVAATDPGTGSANQIGAWHVSGSANSPTLTSDGNIGVASYAVPANVPQPGSSDQIDSSDARLTQAVAAPDPDAGGAMAIWTQHTVNGTGNRSVVRWYELVPSTLSARQQGTVQVATNFVFNGAISPASSGNEAMVFYNVGGSSQLVQIRGQSRTSSTALGTMASEATLGTSAAIDQDFSCPSSDPTAPSCRWGDYAGASPDPTHANVVWGSNQLNGPTSGNNAAWTTRNFAIDTTSPSGGAPTPSPTGGGTPPSGGATPSAVAPVISTLGALPAAVARLLIPSQSLRLPSSRLTGVRLRCGSGRRCAGLLKITVNVQTTRHGVRRLRTVVLGGGRFSIAARHDLTLNVRLSRFASTLLRTHRRVRVRLRASVTGAVTGQAAITRSVWLAAAPTKRR